MTKRERARSRPARANLAVLFLAAALAGCAAQPPDGVTVQRTAVLVEPTATATREVQLPYSRPAPAHGGTHVEFRLPLGAGRPEQGLAVFLSVSTAPVSAFVNGVPVFQNGDALSSPISYQSWRASPSFRVSPRVLSTGANELRLVAYQPAGSGTVLGPVLIGPPALIDRWALREGLLHHAVPVLIGAALLGVGLISLSLWRGRRDSVLFLLLATGTLLWGLQALLQQLPSPLLPAPHNGVLNISLYIWYAMLLAVFFMRFAYLYAPLFERAAAVLAALAAPSLYVGVATGQGATASLVLRALALAAISVALVAVLRYALRERGAKSALLLAAGVLCVGFALRDYAVSILGGGGRTLWLTSYSGLALIVVAGWMLVDRYHRAYAATEASNAELESRVRAASAELARRLEQVQSAREQAEQASLAKSRFFAAASHDLRQPLHSLGLFAGALEGQVFSPEARDIVARIGDSIRALESLFNELLDLSKLDAGAVAVNARNVALQEMFDRLALEFHGEAVARHLRMRFVPTALAVRADPVLLERVLANLVSNALRYTREGGLVVGARRRRDEVWLDVVDTGIGIPATMQQKVFDEFFQIGNPGRDRRRGLGLGLAIVRRLVTLMGHRLMLASTPGKGTRFRLAVPRADAADPRPAPEPDPGVEPFAGRCVLLVEDDPDIRLATARLLAQWGLRVTACKGRRQLEVELEGGLAPDIALVDLRLDAVDDGVDVVELLRARLGPAFPALLLSGDTGAAELARVRASGVPLLTKPVSPARLKSALHAFLSGIAVPPAPLARSA